MSEIRWVMKKEVGWYQDVKQKSQPSSLIGYDAFASATSKNTDFTCFRNYCAYREVCLAKLGKIMISLVSHHGSKNRKDMSRVGTTFPYFGGLLHSWMQKFIIH